MTTSLFHIRARRRARGATLIEGMAGAAVLAIGILGAMQTLIVAAQQNAIATKMVRASQIAAQARMGFESQKIAALTAPGGLLTACTTNAAVLNLTDGLSNLTPAPCVVDMQAFEQAAASTAKIAPGFIRADAAAGSITDDTIFTRVLVATPPNADGVRTITVVVSFRAGVSRFFVRQTAAMYDPLVNQSGTEI